MDGRGEECGGNPDPPGSPHSRVCSGGGVGLVDLGNELEVSVDLINLGEFNGLFSCFVSSLEALSGVGLGCQQTTQRSKISFHWLRGV